jgi:hypothetical protein
MATKQKSRASQPIVWNPDKTAIHIEQIAGAGVAMIRHPHHPFTRERYARTNEEIQREAQSVAEEYLEILGSTKFLDANVLSPWVLNALRQNKGTSNTETPFSWLDIAWGHITSKIANPDPRLSFYVARKGQGGAIDRTLILCAGLLVDGICLQGEVGLRVVMHVAPNGTRKWTLKISGVTLSIPPEVAKVFSTGTKITAVNLIEEIKNHYKEIGAIHGARPKLGEGGSSVLDLFSNRTLGTNTTHLEISSAAITAIEITCRFPSSKIIGEKNIGERVSFSAAIGTPQTFSRSPSDVGTKDTLSKRRPTIPVSREKNDIDKYRRLDSRLPIPAPKKPVKLEYPGVSGVDPLFVVKNSALEGRDASDTRTLDNTELPLRSDDLSAAHAFLRARDLFQRLENYGFDPKIYFRMAKLPLIVRHRAGIHPGAWDGETINAQVRPIGNGLSLTVPYAANDRSALEVRFAAADLSHRRNATDAKRTRPRAQHLGLAADSRWAWHEFGHVLIFAATGELELRFAHSFGDALAAIIHDPESNLAEPRTGVSRDRWRGATFPWASINRRHDRDPALGWGFDSRRFKDSLGDPLAPGERYRSYFGEQVLSSALFRLYDSLGGRSADVALRCSASDYVVYLIIRAAALLGLQSLVPARTPSHFVSAMIDADLGTGPWNVDTPWNDAMTAKEASRKGGRIHKVIRWAFERQGLARTTLSGDVVDIFIADRRVSEPDGGYHPVPLDGDPTNKLAPPQWMASKTAISAKPSNRKSIIEVTVHNHGTADARNVETSVWVQEVDGASNQWTELSYTRKPGKKTIGHNQSATFKFDASQLKRKTIYYVVAATTCSADPTTLDPKEWLTGLHRSEWVHVIAHDNNVAIGVVEF